MSNKRAFGNEIANQMTISSDETANNDIVFVEKTNNKSNGKSEELMEKDTNGDSTDSPTLPLSKILGIELFSLVHNNPANEDDLADEIEDLIEDQYFVGEIVYSSGKEYEVKAKEKRGGLTLYSMTDGSKIGHRDLRRKKGQTTDAIREIVMKYATNDGKMWKISDEIRKLYPLKAKLAPIFTSAKKKAPESDKEDNEEEEEERDQSSISLRGKSATTKIRKGDLEKNAKKAEEAKKKAEEKERKKEEKRKEKEEKDRKKEEEKEAKRLEKEKKSGFKKLDKFLKPKSEMGGETPSIFLSSGPEKRLANGLAKLENAWKKRDQDAFNDACAHCERYLNSTQVKNLENPIFQFGVQKLVDRSKDALATKGMSRAQKKTYRLAKLEERKEHYKKFEHQIRAYFAEDVGTDDLLLSKTKLELDGAIAIEKSEDMLNCMEITQFFVSMAKILLWNENISAEQLHADVQNGYEGYCNSTYKMLRNLVETSLQEEMYEKVAHANARLREFPITEYSLTETLRAFFVGNKDSSSSKQARSDKKFLKEREDDKEEEEEEEEVKEEEEEVKEEDEEEEKNDEENESMEGSDMEHRKKQILPLFANGKHIFEWEPVKIIELLLAMVNTVLELPIIREWYMKNGSTTDEMDALKKKAPVLQKKIEDLQKKLEATPLIEITDEMTRHQTKNATANNKKHESLVDQLEVAREQYDDIQPALARERDTIERIFRTTFIGTDRHLRKYYWFAYSRDAGIWIQDFGTTSYEKWARECDKLGITDLKTDETAPVYVYQPFSHQTERWYRLTDVEKIKELAAKLGKSGEREKKLKKYLMHNMDDIEYSMRMAVTTGPTGSVSRETTPETDKEEEEEDEKMDLNESKFDGEYQDIKVLLSRYAHTWSVQGISRMKDVLMYDTKLDDAKSLDEIKTLVMELIDAVPQDMMIERFPWAVTVARKCYSMFIRPRFAIRIQQATNSSTLHMLLGYFETRIDQKMSIAEQSCHVCHRKSGAERKLMCKSCMTVYHHTCTRPAIGRAEFAAEGFRENWSCQQCRKEERRRAREQSRENGSDDSGSDEDEEEAPRGRAAKRKAQQSMRDMYYDGAGPPLSPVKKRACTVSPKVQARFDEVEEANPRMYKLLINVPVDQDGVLALRQIEEEISSYSTIEELNADLLKFFQYAREYYEQHNERKVADVDMMISKLDL